MSLPWLLDANVLFMKNANQFGGTASQYFSTAYWRTPSRYLTLLNSIHRDPEDAGTQPEEGRIIVEILRKPKQDHLILDDAKKNKGPDPLEDIIGFKITDNGVGFTDANMASFETLDTEHKVARGGRGVGRLLWLKAFKRVHMVSVFGRSEGKFEGDNLTLMLLPALITNQMTDAGIWWFEENHSSLGRFKSQIQG